MEYYVQLPLCGACVSAQEQRTLQKLPGRCRHHRPRRDCARWAVVCTQLSDKLQQAGGRENPRYLPAARRIARALYFDYSIQDDFYPQFNANTQRFGRCWIKCCEINHQRLGKRDIDGCKNRK